MNRNVLLTVLAILTLGVAGGCIWQYSTSQSVKSCTKQLFAMDTSMSFTAYGRKSEQAVDAAIKEVKQLDALLSTGSASSEVSKINEVGYGTLSEDTKEILIRAQEIYQTTDGIFDFTIYPVMSLWGFPTQKYHVPTETELKSALKLVDASKVTLNGNKVTLGENQQIDFGGIAKGYTSSRVMEIFREYGITSGMVSLGGNVQTLNLKMDGSKWNIGIRDPQGSQSSTLAVVSVDNKAVITSGGYERYFEEDGETYIHIIDPRTGYPADQDLISVSIVSEDGTLADALSTSLYIMGLEGATEYWKAYGETEGFDVILVSDSGEVYVSEGLKDDFKTQKEMQIIS